MSYIVSTSILGIQTFVTRFDPSGMFIECASANRVSGLCQVRFLHMLILAATTSASAGEKSSS